MLKRRKSSFKETWLSVVKMLNEITLSRRDDLISLVYMLTYLSSGKLPFIKHHIPLIDQVPRIK